MLAAIAIVFMIMVATFRSLIQPLILLVSIPFAATGAIVLLLVTGTALGVPALIGVLMLVGIVVTNAIVLMDLINQYRAQGMGVQEAVIEGGRRRLRPILMTAIATIFALLPMALGPHRRGRLHLPAAGRGGHRRPGQLDAADPGAGADALHDGREAARRRFQRRDPPGFRRGRRQVPIEMPKHAADEPGGRTPPGGRGRPDSSGGAPPSPAPATSPARRCAATPTSSRC